jgi:hypothetical protein
MSIFLGRRNHRGLTDREIEYCVLAWDYLCGENQRTLILDEVRIDHSSTRFVEDLNVVYLGANAYPGEGIQCKFPDVSASMFSARIVSCREVW